jgi:hypothetical protein
VQWVHVSCLHMLLAANNQQQIPRDRRERAARQQAHSTHTQCNSAS